MGLEKRDRDKKKKAGKRQKIQQTYQTIENREEYINAFTQASIHRATYKNTHTRTIANRYIT